ncbi:MAG: hypothetical protein AAGE52_23175 [Myxococcota bacterium]
MSHRAFFLAVLFACGGGGNNTEAPAGERRPRSEPVEWVGLTTRIPIDNIEAARDFLEPLFGERARSGDTMNNVEVQPGVFLSTFPDSRTPEQAVIQMEMATIGTDERRVILEVPASFNYGRIFIDTALVALTRAAAVEAREEGSMEPFFLEYRTQSVNGGSLSLIVRFEDRESVIELRTNAPQTSLQPGFVNTPAFTGDPIEVLAGTVWFELTKDEFDFFSKRAYGVTAGAAQNFEDFTLLPHDWLRLTVTPDLETQIIDVAFEVVALDGSRLPLARSPASLVAGDQFRENVFRMVTNMNAQEAAEPGSSTPWEVPFYYDDPEGGGVVRVIAQGDAGIFRIAYAVESPINRLQDTTFVPYQGVIEIPDVLTPPETTCADIGSTEALRGRFRVRFDASPTVRESDVLSDPLRGNVWGSVFRAEDVTLAGPKEGAVAVASFAFEDVDATVPGEGMEFLIEEELPVGEYQLLGFMDIDGNGAETQDPDEGDPVTLPIGGFELECAEQPIVVEFALLLPPGR